MCVVSRVRIVAALWLRMASLCPLCILNTSNSSVCRQCQLCPPAAPRVCVCICVCVDPISWYVAVKQETHSVWLFLPIRINVLPRCVFVSQTQVHTHAFNVKSGFTDTVTRALTSLMEPLCKRNRNWAILSSNIADLHPKKHLASPPSL